MSMSRTGGPTFSIYISPLTLSETLILVGHNWLPCLCRVGKYWGMTAMTCPLRRSGVAQWDNCIAAAPPKPVFHTGVSLKPLKGGSPIPREQRRLDTNRVKGHWARLQVGFRGIQTETGF